MIAATSRRTSAIASGLTSLASRNSRPVAGSVFTTGIGRPAESSEIARKVSADFALGVESSTRCQYALSAAGSHASLAETLVWISAGVSVTTKWWDAPRQFAIARWSSD